MHRSSGWNCDRAYADVDAVQYDRRQHACIHLRRRQRHRRHEHNSAGLQPVRVNDDAWKQLYGCKPCSWNVVNLSSPGISMCNVSDPGTGGGFLSQIDDDASIAACRRGNHALWGANEQLQCLWFSEHNNTQNGFTGGFRSNGNRAFYSSFASNAENSDQTQVALGTGDSDPATGSSNGTYFVRVVACPGALDANEKCEKYGAGNEKPIGLLQKYAESGQIKFGLITGSFQKNISGGVVRKNLPASTVNSINSLTDEINSGASGTGQFLAAGSQWQHHPDFECAETVRL